MRPLPDWLIEEPYTDVDRGVLKSGKEAQINLIERQGHDGRITLIARKRYLPRQVTSKGALEAMGVQQASTFRNDVQYREGRQFRKSRDRRAVERMSAYGKRLLQDRWTGHEHEVMSRLWAAGMTVPYPLSYGDDVFDLEYVGDDNGAAPQLQGARLNGADLDSAFEQLVEGLATLVGEGFVHGDLSAYNLLWWRGQLWFIDFPQALDLAANPQGL
ncbi:MAG: RIO1 family regulatory kinase/ATPase, partial [Actinomycetota bacterium]